MNSEYDGLLNSKLSISTLNETFRLFVAFLVMCCSSLKLPPRTPPIWKDHRPKNIVGKRKSPPWSACRLNSPTFFGASSFLVLQANAYDASASPIVKFKLAFAEHELACISWIGLGRT